jgi:O-antigen/teichoic acid export membrane protein
MVGQYSLGLAIVSPIILFASLNLRTLLVTDIEERFEFGHYLGMRLLTTAAVLVVIAGLLCAEGYTRQTRLVILCVAASKCLDALSDIVYGHLQRKEAMDRVALSLIARGVLSTAALSASLLWTHSVLLAAFGIASSSAAVLLLYDLRQIPFARLPRFAGIWPHLRSLVYLAGPPGFILMLVSLNGMLARYWLAHYRSESEVGLFSAMAYLTIAANTMVVALGQASGPAMTRAWDRRDLLGFCGQAARLALMGALLGLAGIAAASLCGNEIVRLLYGARYTADPAALLWLMIGGALTYLASCAGYTLSSARCFRIQLPMHLAVSVVISAACWELVPRCGVWGAAVAQAIGSAVQLAISLLLVIRLCWALAAGTPLRASLIQLYANAFSRPQ